MKRIFDEEQLRAGVARLAAEISADYGTQPLTVIGVLTGCIVLLADLIRQLEMPMRIGLVQASSYRGKATRPGELIIHRDMLPDIQGQDVLIVDDIFDTGRTLDALLRQLQRLEPRSIRSAVLLRKQGRCQVSIQPDYVALDVPDIFVVGYGLDYDDMYRNLPYLAALESDEMGEETV